jgi:uncharacterized protein YsxB (DUF464 family)
MILVDVTRNKRSVINLITVSGHSGYDEIGKDIVCSAVSTAMYISIGLLEKLNTNHRFTSDDKMPIMKLEIESSQEITNTILENLVETLKGISNDYSKYLKINEK